MANPMRLLMLGTGDFALPTFLALVDAGCDVATLVTQPDRPQGRKQQLIPSAIKLAAIDRGVPVDQPEDVNAPEAIARIRDLAPQVLVTAAYGQILSAELLALPPLGGVNLHGSVLPAYRGAAPVARAIQNGERESGVTVIRMTPRIDAGGMIAIARTPIDPDETAGELEARLASLGAPLVVSTLACLVDGTAQVLPQSKAQVTKAPKLRKEDGRIEWSRPARVIHNLVRAMQPWPIASTTWHPAEVGKGPVRLIVHHTTVVDDVSGSPGRILESTGGRLVVAAGQGAIGLERVQLVGGKPLTATQFLNGHHPFPGDRMGDDFLATHGQ